MEQPKVLIIDLGSQYTLVIARTLRELGIRSAVFSPEKSRVWLKRNNPKAIILSGGYASVSDKKAPQPPKEVFQAGVPLLGICYGMQWLTKKLGGVVKRHDGQQEYGSARVTISKRDPLFKGLSRSQAVWASHGDTVSKIPKGFSIIARSKGIAAMSNVSKQIWGVQFHPEVIDTKNGKRMISNFLFDIAALKKDWKPANIIKSIRDEVTDAVGSRKVIGGFSGGVDSTVIFAILAPVLGSKLRGIVIDGDQLRHNEIDEIRKNAQAAGAHISIINAHKEFQKLLSKESDAEKKRAAFKKGYKSIFEREARAFKADAIVQGTLATDLIESGATGGMLIKSHHNVGLNLQVKSELHPFRDLFKYEVRALARSLKLPKTVTERTPFPGPGLFVRIIGKPATTQRLQIVRDADALVTDVLRAHKYEKEYSQLVVALDTTPTVGVKGDERVYANSAIIRAINTTDFMTATGHQFPANIRREITERVTAHPDIVRVFYDETNKPPATTELE